MNTPIASQAAQATQAAVQEEAKSQAPAEDDFFSDKELSGGTCDMSPGCESCQ